MKMKKLLSLGVSLLLIVLLLPTTALAEGGNEYVARNETTKEEYVSLKEALDVATDGDTIILLKDCKLSSNDSYDPIYMRKSITLDLNGCTMTLQSVFSVQSGATFTIQNNKNTGGITVECESAFSAIYGTKVNLIGVTITEADTTVKKWLFGAASGSTHYIENCDITWSGICQFDGDSTTIKDTKINLTGSEDAIVMRSQGGKLKIVNSIITGKGANLFITPDNNNVWVQRPSVSIANDKPQDVTIEYSYSVPNDYNNGKFILPGLSDAKTQLKAMLADSFKNTTLLVTVPEGLYINATALECLGTAESGKTYTIERAGAPEQMEELAKPGAVPANGCIIKNGTDAAITVNGVIIQPGQSHTFTEKEPDPEIDPPSTITIIVPAEEPPAQPNPSTGAPQLIAVAAAASAIATILAAVLLLLHRREKEA